jgi:hypothetical protein
MCQSVGDACSNCAFSSCNAEYCACYVEQDCAAIVNCFQTCPTGDMACQQTCMTMHPDSISLAFLLGDCASNDCAAECPGVRALDPCEACLFTSCSTQMNTCLSNPDCTALLQCVHPACAPTYSMTCVGNCAALHPGGQTDGLAVYSCLTGSCATACMM